MSVRARVWRGRPACWLRGYALVVTLLTETSAGVVCNRCLISQAVPVQTSTALRSLLAPVSPRPAVDPVESALLMAGAMLNGDPLAVTAAGEAGADALVAVHLARWLCESLGTDRRERLEGMSALSLREQMRGLG